jgi:hypothetical protein
MVLDDGPTDCALTRTTLTPKVEDLAVETTALTVTRR